MGIIILLGVAILICQYWIGAIIVKMNEGSLTIGIVAALCTLIVLNCIFFGYAAVKMGFDGTGGEIVAYVVLACYSVDLFQRMAS